MAASTFTSHQAILHPYLVYSSVTQGSFIVLAIHSLEWMQDGDFISIKGSLSQHPLAHDNLRPAPHLSELEH